MLVEDFKLENWINENESFTKYDLSCTCVSPLSLEELNNICDFDYKSFNTIKLSYGDIFGSNELKTAICNLYEHQTPDNITITHGGIGANQLVLQTILEKNDKVVCVCPCYQQMYSLPRFYGAKVELFKLNPKDWSLDIEKFRQVVGNDTKLICITTPNNPTGRTLNEINEVIEIARNIGAFIFSDEAYRGLNHDLENYSASISDLYEKGISTGSMSKAYALAGIRLGWVVADKEIIKNINLNREYNTISVSRLDDYVATKALQNHEKILERNLKIVLNGKKLVNEFIKNSNGFYNWVEPNSGTIGFLNYNSELNSKDFCKKLLEDTQVLLVPAEVFEYENFLRIGYSRDKEYLVHALELINNWTKRTF